MGDACIPWNVWPGRCLLPDVCGWGFSQIASAVVCLEWGCMLLTETTHQTFGFRTFGVEPH